MWQAHPALNRIPIRTNNRIFYALKSPTTLSAILARETAIPCDCLRVLGDFFSITLARLFIRTDITVKPAKFFLLLWLLNLVFSNVTFAIPILQFSNQAQLVSIYKDEKPLDNITPEAELSMLDNNNVEQLVKDLKVMVDTHQTQMQSLIKDNQHLHAKVERIRSDITNVKEEIQFYSSLQHKQNEQSVFSQFDTYQPLFANSSFWIVIPLLCLSFGLLFLHRRKKSKQRQQQQAELNPLTTSEHTDATQAKKLNLVLVESASSESNKKSEEDKEDRVVQELAELDGLAYQMEASCESLDKSQANLMDLDSLPEYDENIALDDTDEEEMLEPFNLDTKEKQRQAQQVEISLNASKESLSDISALSFTNVEVISLDEIGEFEENDAFNAALDEQKELEEFTHTEDGQQK